MKRTLFFYCTARVSKRPTDESTACLRAQYCTGVSRSSADWKFCAHTLIACLFLQFFFTLSTPTLTYPASQHISKAIYHHKLPRFSAGENISAPHQIKLSSSNSFWSLSSVKQPGKLPGYIR